MYARAAMRAVTVAWIKIPPHWNPVACSMDCQLLAIGVMNAMKEYRSKRAVDCFGVIVLIVVGKNFVHGRKISGLLTGGFQWWAIGDKDDRIVEGGTVEFSSGYGPVITRLVDSSSFQMRDDSLANFQNLASRLVAMEWKEPKTLALQASDGLRFAVGANGDFHVLSNHHRAVFIHWNFHPVSVFKLNVESEAIVRIGGIVFLRPLASNHRLHVRGIDFHLFFLGFSNVFANAPI